MVPYTATQLTVTPTAADAAATITVNGVAVASGSPSAPINVSGSSTVITVVVVSPDTTVTNTYTLTATHAAPSSNATLASLVPSAGTLSPSFDGATTSYTATVPNAITGLTVTPTTADGAATITVNGSPVTSGSASGTIALNVGPNIITTVVLAEDHSTTTTYTLTVQRTANADLAGLVPSVGTLTPAFAITTYSYTASVPFSAINMTVTPTASDPAAHITVNGSPVTSGSPSAAIVLAVGTNVITTVVTSQDLATTNTYTLTVTRIAPGSRWWDGGTTAIAGNGDGASAGGAGTWDTTIQNWDQGNGLAHAAWVNSDDDSAVFAGTAGTVTVGTAVSASGLRFDTAGYIVTGNTLTLTAGGTITTNANATVSSTLAGTTGITKAGSATLTLTGANTISGGTQLNGGSVLVDVPSTGGVTNGTLTSTALGTGTITLGANATLGSGHYAFSDGNTIGLGNAVAVGTYNLTLAESSAYYKLNVTGVVSGSGTITDNTGTNTVTTLSNNSNTFSGKLIIGGGNTLNFGSMGDGGSVELNNGSWVTTAGAAAMTFNTRFVNLTGSTSGGTITNNATSPSSIIVINTNSQAAAGAKTLTLGGSNTGANESHGSIVNGSGTVALAKAGTSTWNLTGTSTYSGQTSITGGGTLAVNTIDLVGNASALGKPTTAANGIILLGSGANGVGTLAYTGAGNTTDRQIQIGGQDQASHSGGIYNNGTGALTFSAATFTISDPTTAGSAGTRNLTLGGTYAGGSNEIQGVIAANAADSLRPVAIIKAADASIWKLSGVNTYTGTTTVQGGTLILGSDAPSGSAGSLGNATSEVILGVAGGNTAAGIVTGGAFTVGRAIRIPTNNTTDSGTRVLTLGGGTADASVFAGNIFLGTTNQAGRGVTLTAAGGGQVTFAGVIQNPSGMDATSYTVTKAGLGSVILSNANTYTGATSVSAGTLTVTGSLGATAVTVISNATLAGNGNIGGNVTISPGAHHALAVAATPGAQVARAITGTLTMTGSTLDLTAASSPATGTYVLATATTTITGTATTINYNGITGTVSVDNASAPRRLLLTVTAPSGYAGWAVTHAPTGTAKDDYDGDGVSNAVEYVLGGSKTTNDRAKLPQATTSGGNLVFTFLRDQKSIDGATSVAIEVGSDLVNWPNSYAVPDSAAANNPGVSVVKNSSPGFDTVTLTLPQAVGAKFARLKVLVPSP